jgi:CRISPR-associated protein Csx3
MPEPIIVYGPPRSGKSVGVYVIANLLPRDRFLLIEGAPDGEGITGWAHIGDQGLVQSIRQKRHYTPEFVEWVVRSIRSSTSPITLVDVGGKRSKEVELISRLCRYFIVISNDQVETSAWREFGEGLGLKPLALLSSSLTGEDELIEDGHPLHGKITRLDRHHPPLDSRVAKAVAARIIEVTASSTEEDGSGKADVLFPSLAEELRVPSAPGGSGHMWDPTILPQLLHIIPPRVAGKREVRLWGNMPSGFPYHALACALLTQRVRYYDPKVGNSGYVPLPDLKLRKKRWSNNLHWRVEERSDYVVVEFCIQHQVFDVFDLPDVLPPAVPIEKGVVVSGKGPWWLTGAIVRAYARKKSAWVAIFAPRESGKLINGVKWSHLHPGMCPAIILASRDLRVPVGSIFPFLLHGGDSYAK